MLIKSIFIKNNINIIKTVFSFTYFMTIPRIYIRFSYIFANVILIKKR
jgi:hypothetical protein